MPIYEYQCALCGRVFEELIRGPSDEAELACPACKGTKLSRQMSVFGVQGDVAKPIISGGGGGCGGCSASSCGGCGSKAKA